MESLYLDYIQFASFIEKKINVKINKTLARIKRRTYGTFLVLTNLSKIYLKLFCPHELKLLNLNGPFMPFFLKKKDILLKS